MARVIRELGDPAGIALAVITGVVNWRLGVSVGLAVGAALAVLAVRTAAATLWPSGGGSGAAPAITSGSNVTRREQEIAELVADGLTNKEIASKLFLSERTVDNHVQHLLNKLNFGSRAQIAAWVGKRRGSEK
jgi:DNA-binding NarL/FixJ family response regulator